MTRLRASLRAKNDKKRGGGEVNVLSSAAVCRKRRRKGKVGGDRAGQIRSRGTRETATNVTLLRRKKVHGKSMKVTKMQLGQSQ